MIGTQTLAQQTHSKTPKTAPLSSHPGFTPAVMVWCAALLGLSCLAIRGSLLESWVIAAKVDLFLPMATPPLGATSRLLLAVGFAVLGAGIGWLAARMIRPAPASNGDDFQLRQRDRHPDAPARRPISAHAELGEEGFGRASSARDDFLADLPAFRTAAVDPFAPAPYVPAPVQAAQPAPAYTPVFAAADAPAPIAAPAMPDPAPYVAPAATAHDDMNFDLPVIDFDDAPQAQAEPTTAETEAPPEAAAPDPMEQAWETLPPLVSETDVIPLTLRPVSPLRAVSGVPVAKPAAPVEAPAMIGATPVKPRAAAHERISQAPLGDLSHLELIERLAMAIHTREKDKGPAPTAVNDTQDMPSSAASHGGGDDRPAIQAHLRTALASLREVK